MDDTTRSIIRNVKGPGTFPAPHISQFHLHLKNAQIASWLKRFYEKRRQANFMGPQSVKMTFSACSSPNVKPED
jgi:hypothetical protein